MWDCTRISRRINRVHSNSITVQGVSDTCNFIGTHVWTVLGDIEPKLNIGCTHCEAQLPFNGRQVFRLKTEIDSEWYEIYCVKLFATAPMPSIWFCFRFDRPKKWWKNNSYEPMPDGQWWFASILKRHNWYSPRLRLIRRSTKPKTRMRVSINYLFI